MASTLPLIIYLRNHTTSGTLYAYVTALDGNTGARFFVQSDAQTLYYPPSPQATNQPLDQDAAIDLGKPNHTRIVRVPTYFAGGRIYFVRNDKLTFRINPGSNGAALVEPSVLNPSDPNIHKDFSFAELSFNSAQVFANITYVDFVSIPVALTLYANDGSYPQHVSGMRDGDLGQIADGLRAQNKKDNAGWDRLIVHGKDGQILRILSPNSAISTNGALFSGYYHRYVNEVWDRYRDHDLTVNTQAQFGNVSGRVNGDGLTLGGASFIKPMTRDIFSCSTGPFQTGSDIERNAIIPRLAAAFNRTTLLLESETPDGDSVKDYYQHSPTNHYSRIVHAHNVDGKGYAFPYDDVTKTDGSDVAGVVYGPPRILICGIGGSEAGLKPAEIHQNHHEL